MKRTDRRSDCPVSFALETFGDSWTLLVIRDLMFNGKATYTEFLQSEEGIATNVLASRLRQLEKRGLIRRRGSGRGMRYALTEKGLDLLPVMLAIVDWSASYDPRTAAPPAFVARLRKDREGTIAELRRRLRRAYGLKRRRAGGVGR